MYASTPAGVGRVPGRASTGDMTVSNQRVSEILGQTADLLEIEGANPFRFRAYRTAARGEATSGNAARGKAGSSAHRRGHQTRSV